MHKKDVSVAVKLMRLRQELNSNFGILDRYVIKDSFIDTYKQLDVQSHIYTDIRKVIARLIKFPCKKRCLLAF